MILDEAIKHKIEIAIMRTDDIYRALDFEEIFFERYPNLDARNLSTHSILAHTYNPMEVYFFAEMLHATLIETTSIGLKSPYIVTEKILHVQNVVSDYLTIFRKIFAAQYNAVYPNKTISTFFSLRERLCPFRSNWTFHQIPNFTPLMLAVIRPRHSWINDMEKCAIQKTSALWQKNTGDVNQQDNITGMTAFHYVFMGHIFSDTQTYPGREKLINILIAMGCDATIKDNSGHSVLFYAMCQLQSSWDYKDGNAKFIMATLLVHYVEKLLALNADLGKIHITRDTITSIAKIFSPYNKDSLLTLIIELDAKGNDSELFKLINPHLKKPSDKKRNRAAFLQEQASSSLPVDDTYIEMPLDGTASSCPMLT